MWHHGLISCITSSCTEVLEVCQNKQNKKEEVRGMWMRVFPLPGVSRWFPFVIIHLLLVTTSYASTSEDSLVSRIAFGSCSNQSLPQPIWNGIINFNPQVFIWLGDTIYGDNKRPFKLFGKERTIGPWKNVPRFIPSSEQEMDSRYHQAKTNPGYSYIRQHSKVIGTWDDHDYGLNNAGKEFTGKVTNQRLLLDFLDEPIHSARRKQAGVYASYTFGPIGKQIKVILLDTRYHRDPLSSDGSMLGSSQWKWLEKQLHGPSTAITIIGSSIQVISNLSAVTSPIFSIEGWGRFPTERNRLFKLIADSKRDGILFISGDVHFGEMARYDCATGYPLYDVTSSGLTQSVEGVVPSPLHHLVSLMAWLAPTTMRLIPGDCRYKSCAYGQPNFGTIEVDWESDPIILRIQVRDVNGSPVISKTIFLTDLQAGSTEIAANIHEAAYRKHCTREVDLPWAVRYSFAILLICFLSVLVLTVLGLLCATIFVSKQCLRKYKHD